MKYASRTLVLSAALAFVPAVASVAIAEEGVTKQVNATDPAEDRKVLAERASKYWTARAKTDPQRYTFYAPPELGGPVYLAEVSESGNIGFKSWKIEGVEVAGNVGTVKVRIEPTFMNAFVKLPESHKTTVVAEKWNKVEGVWYKQPVPPGFRQHYTSTRKARHDAAQSAEGATEAPKTEEAEATEAP